VTGGENALCTSRFVKNSPVKKHTGGGGGPEERELSVKNGPVGERGRGWGGEGVEKCSLRKRKKIVLYSCNDCFAYVVNIFLFFERVCLFVRKPPGREHCPPPQLPRKNFKCKKKNH
jgi:hypothetical protein